MALIVNLPIKATLREMVSQGTELSALLNYIPGKTRCVCGLRRVLLPTYLWPVSYNCTLGSPS